MTSEHALQFAEMLKMLEVRSFADFFYEDLLLFDGSDILVLNECSYDETGEDQAALEIGKSKLSD